MTGTDDREPRSHGAAASAEASPRPVSASVTARLAPLALSCAALALIFWGLFQLDIPLARFLRAVHQPWLERAGALGSWLGSGAVLVALSGSLFLAGWARGWPVCRRAGLEGLLAHGGVALTVNLLKHLVGRPRPRMTHAEGLPAGPSLASGLDSFPSGHAAAAFAVAAVLAKHYPRLAWWPYGVAGFVAFSRVFRGSHFPTDVLAGAALGLVAGYLASNPVRAWRTSVSRALCDLAPVAAGAFAILWVACQSALATEPWGMLSAAGALAMVGGFAVRWTAVARQIGGGQGGRADAGTSARALALPSGAPRWATALIGTGLAATGGSGLVALVAALTGAAWVARDPEPGEQTRTRATWMSVVREGCLALGAAGAVATLRAARGVLPLL
ncbi:phosphatase PAP2 family protein [Nitrospira sp. Kam-Ns4a]